MQFLIPLRNAATGEERNFHNKQEVADFLASREDDADWEGHTCLGKLPEPTPAGEDPVEPVPVETPEQAEALKVEAQASEQVEREAKPTAEVATPVKQESAVKRAIKAVADKVARKPAAKKAPAKTGKGK